MQCEYLSISIIHEVDKEENMMLKKPYCLNGFTAHSESRLLKRHKDAARLN